jgi:hypothetical protein
MKKMVYKGKEMVRILPVDGAFADSMVIVGC